MPFQIKLSKKTGYLGVLISLVLGLTFSSSINADESGCKAKAEWFPHSQTTEPDHANFPTGNGVTNCDFHQWSWQMFLWLTQTDEQTQEPRFLSYQSPDALLPDGEKSSGVLTAKALLPRMAKSNEVHSLDEIAQAGSDAILVGLNGRAIYYSQHINQTFVDFVKENNLNNPESVRKFNPDTSFPVGTIELKASWKIVQENESADGFFTKQDHVYKLKNKNGQIQLDLSAEPQEVTLALVGLHIGGVVEGHPEMIWATFEHKNNAPNVKPGTQPGEVVSDKNFTFYEAGTKYKNCNVNAIGRQTLDEATQTISPVTQICRLYQYGNAPNSPSGMSQSIARNDVNIETLNASVVPELKDSVWDNYAEVGAIWFLAENGLKPNMSLDQYLGNVAEGSKQKVDLTGSFKLSNSTIETFTQTQSTKDNCFRCHNTQQQLKEGYDSLPGMNLNISHTFVNLYFRTQK